MSSGRVSRPGPRPLLLPPYVPPKRNASQMGAHRPSYSGRITAVARWGERVSRSRTSAVEPKPAQLVAQRLVVEHKFSDLVGELGALPLALQAASRLALVFSRRRTLGLDRIGRSTELVGPP